MIYKYIRKVREYTHSKFMKERFSLFLNNIELKKGDFIIDLGGRNAEFMELFGDKKDVYNILIVDIDEDALNEAKKKGFKTLLINESGPLPFKDKEIDVIFCNSVIEHYTVEKDTIWAITDGNLFKTKSLEAQSFFAKEIDRVGKKYFIQTPDKSFPIESHSFFPFMAKFSRLHQIRLINLLNKFWIKKTSPDWYLLNEKEMRYLFPNAKILKVKWMGFSKELIAIKN